MNWIRLSLLTGLVVLPTQAVTLTFDIGNPAQLADNSSVTQNYGDRVTAASMADGGLTYGYGLTGGFTPNVVVSYGPASITTDNAEVGCPFNLTDTCVYLWSTQFGGLTNVIAQSADPTHNDYGKIVVTLAADAGYLVNLSSFDLGGWSVTDRAVGQVTVRDVLANTVLFSSNSVVAAGSGQTTLDAATFGGLLSGQVLEITIDSSNQPGGNGQNVGLDNITFSQTGVPEPSTIVLAGGALVLLGMFGRRSPAK